HAVAARREAMGPGHRGASRHHRRARYLATAWPGRVEIGDGKIAAGHHGLSANRSAGARVAYGNGSSESAGADLRRARQTTQGRSKDLAREAAPICRGIATGAEC